MSFEAGLKSVPGITATTGLGGNVEELTIGNDLSGHWDGYIKYPKKE